MIFATSLEIAKNIALKMNVEANDIAKHRIVRKRQFDEISEDEQIQSPNDIFKIKYFFVVVDVTISYSETYLSNWRHLNIILEFCLIQII